MVGELVSSSLFTVGISLALIVFSPYF